MRISKGRYDSSSCLGCFLSSGAFGERIYAAFLFLIFFSLCGSLAGPFLPEEHSN